MKAAKGAALVLLAGAVGVAAVGWAAAGIGSELIGFIRSAGSAPAGAAGDRSPLLSDAGRGEAE